MRRRTIKDDGPDPFDVYVGSRVRARRLGLRVSQTKLGDATGVTFQQVQKYENGTNRIGAARLYRIARTLGVEVAYFFEGIENLEAAAFEDMSKGDTPEPEDRGMIQLQSDLGKMPEAVKVCTQKLFKTLAQEQRT